MVQVDPSFLVHTSFWRCFHSTFRQNSSFQYTPGRFFWRRFRSLTLRFVLMVFLWRFFLRSGDDHNHSGSHHDQTAPAVWLSYHCKSGSPRVKTIKLAEQTFTSFLSYRTFASIWGPRLSFIVFAWTTVADGLCICLLPCRSRRTWCTWSWWRRGLACTHLFHSIRISCSVSCRRRCHQTVILVFVLAFVWS